MPALQLCESCEVQQKIESQYCLEQTERSAQKTMGLLTLDDLEALRMKGFCPEGFILLSSIGKIPGSDPVFLLRHNDSDFSCLHRLEVELLINNAEIGFMNHIVPKILEADPLTLWIFNVDTGYRTEIRTLGLRLIVHYKPDPELDRYLESESCH